MGDRGTGEAQRFARVRRTSGDVINMPNDDGESMFDRMTLDEMNLQTLVNSSNYLIKRGSIMCKAAGYSTGFFGQVCHKASAHIVSFEIVTQRNDANVQDNESFETGTGVLWWC